jgi:hypothetical protein
MEPGGRLLAIDDVEELILAGQAAQGSFDF